MAMLELDDIQALFIAPPRYPFGRYTFLSFDSAEAGRAWLAQLANHVPSAQEGLDAHAADVGLVSPVYVAFTHHGLRALGVDDASLATFCRKAIESLGAQALNAPNHPIDKLGTIHFFRELLINNDSQLLLIAIFDGDTLQYVKDFHDILIKTEGTPAFAYCEGWPENWREDQQAYIEFYVGHMAPASMEYSYYPFATCREVRKALTARESFTTMLDQMQ